jgi:histidine ammonia-lyase
MARTQGAQADLQTLLIDGNSLRLEHLEPVARNCLKVELSTIARAQLEASRQVVEQILSSGQAVYAVTTGFGKFKDIRIAPEDSHKLQRNLILSHAAGVGPPFDTEVVRLALLLRANALAKGYSGIRTQVVELLLSCLNAGVHPLIPEQGSLGASGDLAPLAHMALVLIGEGKAEYKGQLIGGKEALSQAGLTPVELAAKEGLALINGTQIMAAVGALVLLEAERLAKVADIVGAMSLEAQLGSPKPFAEAVHKLRPHPGQLQSAANLRLLLANSGLVESHKDCPLVQDAYSLRCMPQVHGASRQAFSHIRSVLEIEINAATDNPLIFDDGAVSAGNFHGQPLAFALDYGAIALSELANISERRIERLVNPALSNGLPAFLTEFGGLNSGLMIAQYTAAALVSENKSLAHPASVDSIPTSANQEDHVSMGTIACRKARMILRNTRKVLAIELMCAAQGLDFRLGNGYSHKDESGCAVAHAQPGPGIKAAYELTRKHIAHLEEDREIHKDIEAAEHLIVSGELIESVESALGQLV